MPVESGLVVSEPGFSATKSRLLIPESESLTPDWSVLAKKRSEKATSFLKKRGNIAN